ncbi:MAG TPA: DUF1761 domain-containing protein [Candidatus Elarobacter sp.]|jgi:hypothetical protein
MTARRPNYLAILAGAVVFFAFGAIWYTVLSGAWLAAVGKTKAELGMSGVTPFIVSLAAALLIAYCFDNMLWHYERADAAKGAQVGLLTGVCIGTALLATTYSFEGRPVALIAIDAGYAVFGFMASGAVVGALRGRATRQLSA